MMTKNSSTNAQDQVCVLNLLSQLERYFTEGTPEKRQFIAEIAKIKHVVSTSELQSQADWINLKLSLEEFGRHLFDQGITLSLSENAVKSELSKIIDNHEKSSRGRVGLIASLLGLFR